MYEVLILSFARIHRNIRLRYDALHIDLFEHIPSPLHRTIKMREEKLCFTYSTHKKNVQLKHTQKMKIKKNKEEKKTYWKNQCLIE